MSTSVEKIRSALPAEQSKLFFGLVNTFGIHEDDDRLVILAAMAMLLAKNEDLVSRFEEVAPLIADAPERVKAALANGLVNLDSTVAESIERSVAVTLDMMSNEVRSLVRELVVTEMTAASKLRSQAIEDEARGVRRVFEQMLQDAGGSGGLATAKAAVGGRNPWGDRILWALGGVAVALLIVGAILRFHH